MSKTTETLTITVSNDGPFDEAIFKVEMESPGLYLAIGKPESGKDNLLRSIEFASEEDPKPLDMRRHRVAVNWDATAKPGRKTPVGQITLPCLTKATAGVSFTSARVTKLPGKTSLGLLPGKQFVALTRGPSNESDAARRKREFNAFAQITRIKSIAKSLVCEEHRPLVKDIEDGLLPDVQGLVWRRFHDLKNGAKTKVADIERKLTVCQEAEDLEAARSEVDTVDVETVHLAAFESELSTLRTNRQTREAVEKERVEFQAIHSEERPDSADLEINLVRLRTLRDEQLVAAAKELSVEPDVESAQLDVDELAAREMAQIEAGAKLERNLVEIQGQLKAHGENSKRIYEEGRKARTHLNTLEDDHDKWIAAKAGYDHRKANVSATGREISGLEREAREIERQADKWDRREALLSTDPVGPTVEDVEAGQVSVDEQQIIVAMAKRKEAELKRDAEEDQLDGDLAVQQANVDEYLTAATDSLQGFVRTVLESHEVEGWGISDGQLMVMDPARNELIPLIDLSGSETDKAALKLIVAHAPRSEAVKHHLMLLPQDSCDGMLSGQLQELAKWAEGSDTYILAGKVAEGELRIERVVVK